jgi:hypothetical protein
MIALETLPEPFWRGLLVRWAGIGGLGFVAL